MKHLYGTELTAKIRQDLANAGYKRSDFNVRLGNSLYETAVHVFIKNPRIRKSEVEEIVQRYESIDRDPWSHEILMGGNTFIFVEYRWGIWDEVIKDYLPRAQEIINNVQEYNGKVIAESKTAKVGLCIMDDEKYRLYEMTGQNGCHLGFYVWDAQTLAEALWRFDNIGTIYA